MKIMTVLFGGRTNGLGDPSKVKRGNYNPIPPRVPTGHGSPTEAVNFRARVAPLVAAAAHAGKPVE